MADSFQVNIEAMINQSGVNIEVNTPIVTGVPVYSVQSVILANGTNSFTVPTGAKNLIIIPNSGNVNTYKLKGVVGDTGVDVMRDYRPMLLNVLPGATFVITSSGLDTLATILIWF